MSQFSYLDDAFATATVSPMAAATFGTESGGYFLRNTAPHNPSPQNTMVPKDYCVENITPVPFPGPSSSTSLESAYDHCGIRRGTRIDPGFQPDLVAQPVLRAGRQHIAVVGGQVTPPPEDVVVGEPIPPSRRRRRKSCNVRSTNFQIGDAPLCFVDSLVGVVRDVLNWKRITFPKNTTTFASRLQYVLTREDRGVYMALAALILFFLLR